MALTQWPCPPLNGEKPSGCSEVREAASGESELGPLLPGSLMEAVFAASLTPDLWPVGADPSGCSFRSAGKSHVLRADFLVASFIWPDLLFLFGVLPLATSLLSISPPNSLGSNADSLF